MEAIGGLVGGVPEICRYKKNGIVDVWNLGIMKEIWETVPVSCIGFGFGFGFDFSQDWGSRKVQLREERARDRFVVVKKKTSGRLDSE